MTLTVPTSDMILSQWSALARDDLRSVDILVYNEGDDWREWGDRVASTAVQMKGAPLTGGFGDWREWVQSVIGALGQ